MKTDWPKSSSNSYRLNKFFLAAALLLPLCLAGCVQPKPVTSEIVKKSGFDVKGRPVAFSVLPKDKFGEVNWVTSLKEGILNPKDSLEVSGGPPSPILNLDIVFNISDAYPVPHVVFPHAPHTMWLNCNNCHPAIFIMKQGANPVSMDRIIRGEFCGRCHGVVAFQFTDCLRCHSRPK